MQDTFNPELAASLTKQEMLEMRLNGLSPFNAADVKRFKSGKGITEAEKRERAEKLFGASKNLGGGSEADINPDKYLGKEFTSETFQREVAPQQPRAPQDFRKQLNEDMGEYGSAAGKVYGSDDFVSLKKPPVQQIPTAQGVNVEQIKQEGFEASKQYVNAFVLNLQNPSSQSRLNLFKLLKTCLEGEVKYKNNPQALAAYKQGVMQAEQRMLQQLQS